MRELLRLAVMLLCSALAAHTYAAVVTWTGDASDPGGVTAPKPWVSTFWSIGAQPAGGNGGNPFTGDDAQINNGGHVLIDASQNIGLASPAAGAMSGTGFITLGAGTSVGVSEGFLEMTGGSIVTAFDVRIAGNASATVGFGTFTQSGGTVSMNGGNLNVGFGVNANGWHSTGTYNLSGGSFIERSGTIIAIGNRGNGTVNQSGGDLYLMALNNANVNNAVLQLGRLTTGATKSSSGTYSLSGGRLVAANTQFGNGSPAGGLGGPVDNTPTTSPTDGPSINTFSLSGTGLLVTSTIGAYNNLVDPVDPGKSTVNTFNMTGGTLTATTIGMSITNDGGTLAPATTNFNPAGMPENIDDFLTTRYQSIGTTTISGSNSYTQTANGTLAIDLASQSSYDQLVVNSGFAVLDGTLALNVHSGFVGSTGDTYQVVFGNTLGTFATVTGNDLGGGLKLNKITDPIGVYLLAAMPGDTDLNKVVEFEDLNNLLTNYGLSGFTGIGQWNAGDFDDDHAVTFDDLNTLLSNYGLQTPLAAAAAPVPEPSTLILIASGLAGIGMVRRRNPRTQR